MHHIEDCVGAFSQRGRVHTYRSLSVHILSVLVHVTCLGVRVICHACSEKVDHVGCCVTREAHTGVHTGAVLGVTPTSLVIGADNELTNFILAGTKPDLGQTVSDFVLVKVSGWNIPSF